MVTVTELVTGKRVEKQGLKVFLQPNPLTTKTAGDRIKTVTRNMKKTLMTMMVLVGMTASAMMLSAFATPKQDAKAESSQIQMNDDAWKLFHTGVAYCNGDTDQCVGRGDVWVNTDTYQVKIRLNDQSSPKNGGGYDLTEYTRKDGYNYRFWHSYEQTYYYVYINVRFN